MSGVIDAFYILFKSNSEDVIKGNKAIDKSTKETERSLKNTNEEAVTLGSSFVKMVEGAASAAGAFAGFEMLKNGVNQANALNLSYDNLGKTLGTTAEKVKQYVQASLEAGGSAQGAVGELLAGNARLNTSGASLKNPQGRLDAARALIYGQNLSPAAISRIFDQFGITDAGSQRRVRDYTNAEYEESKRSAERNAKLSAADTAKAAQVIHDQAAVAGSKSNFFTKLNTGTAGGNSFFQQKLADLANYAGESPGSAVAGGVGVLATTGGVVVLAMTALVGKLLSKSIGKFLQMGLKNFPSFAKSAGSYADSFGSTISTGAETVAGGFGVGVAGAIAIGLGEIVYGVKQLYDLWAPWVEEQLNARSAATGRPKIPTIAQHLNNGKDPLQDFKDAQADPAHIAAVKASGAQWDKNAGIVKANKILGQASSISKSYSGGGVNIDTININTQATDSAGIASSLDSALKTHLNNAQVNVDDGQAK